METTKDKGFRNDAEQSGKAAVPMKTWKNIVSSGIMKKVLLTAVGLFAFYLLSLTLVYCIPKSAMVETVSYTHLRYALFVSFFPQLVAGPIERSKNLLHQLREKHTFDFDRVKDGLLLMLWRCV